VIIASKKLQLINCDFTPAVIYGKFNTKYVLIENGKIPHMNLTHLLKNPPKLHTDEQENPISWGMTNKALTFIHDTIHPAWA